MKDRKGILIAFEGIDGTGKSTQLGLLSRYLQQLGRQVVETREPTGGAYGKKIRELYTNRGKCTLEEELELFVLDRRQHVEEVIRPALADDKIVLTDRYYFSTAAYQGAAGCDPERVFKLNEFAPEPDMVLLLTIDPGISVERIQKYRKEQLNDFEQEEQLRRVAGLFASFPHSCIRRLDAGNHVDTVQTAIRTLIDGLLEYRAKERCG